MFHYQLFRDQLVLNKQLSEKIQSAIKKYTDQQTQRTNCKVILGARQVLVPKGTTFTLKDCDLVICTDIFNAKDGIINLEVSQVPAMGVAGYKGRDLTIFCKNYFPGSGFKLKGGKGGQGKTGDVGTAGKDGTAADINGKVGGKGKTGKTGCKGGTGGKVEINYITINGAPNSVSAATVAPGGDGGIGGNGGPGGPGGKGWTGVKAKIGYVEGKDGPKGAVGAVGAKGAAGVAGTYSEYFSGYYQKIGSATESLSKLWGKQRLIQGEYLFRSVNQSNRQNLDKALHEFNEAQLLDPALQQAQNYKNQLLDNINILGMSRSADVVPDFSRYEKVYVDYYPMISTLFNVADRMVSDHLNNTTKTIELNNAVNTVKGITDALQDELSSAMLAMQAANAEEKKAIERVSLMTQKISAKKEELLAGGADILGTVVGVASAFIGVLAAIPSGGMSLAAGFAAFAAFAGAVDEAGVVNIIKEAGQPADKQPTIDKLKAESKGFVEAFKDIQSKVATIISFAKTIEDLNSANLDDPEYRQLLEQSVELAHASLIAQYHKREAEFRVSAAKKRLEQSEQDLNALKVLRDNTNQTKKVFGQAAISLAKIIRHYCDILNQYIFMAARAVEIYTLRDMSSAMYFDKGSIAPDREADYVEEFNLDSNNTKAIVDYLIAIRSSWTDFAKLIDLRDAYESYIADNRVDDCICISVTDQQILQKFIAKPELAFSIPLRDFTNRNSAKVQKVEVALIGAQSVNGIVSATLVHSGHYFETDKTGKIHEFFLKPRMDVALAKHTPLHQGAGQAAMAKGSFGGRGVAADWRLVIESLTDDNPNNDHLVNLAGLNEIQVWIYYQAFNAVTPLVAGNETSPMKNVGIMGHTLNDQEFILSEGKKVTVKKLSESLSLVNL